jgi:hypothetical protein
MPKKAELPQLPATFPQELPRELGKIFSKTRLRELHSWFQTPWEALSPPQQDILKEITRLFVEFARRHNHAIDCSELVRTCDSALEQARQFGLEPFPVMRNQVLAEQHRQEILRKISAWISAGWLTPFGNGSLYVLLLQARRRPPFSADVDEFLQTLKERGVDTEQVVNILCGRTQSSQLAGINPVEQYREWTLIQENASLLGARPHELKRLRAYYASLDRHITRAHALSSTFMQAWQQEYALIQAALETVSNRHSLDLRKPHGPFTVRLHSTEHQNRHLWPRHKFWTPVIVALVEVWKQAHQSEFQAFRDIAALLSKAFPPYPDNPNLVKQRYIRGKKSGPL